MRKNKQITAPVYTAAISQDGDWWIGWIEEIPGVNSQGKTKTELLANLTEVLAEAIDLNREEQRRMPSK